MAESEWYAPPDITRAHPVTLLPAYHPISVISLLGCVRRFLGITVNIKDGIDLEVGPLFFGSVGGFSRVAMNVKNGVDLEVCSLCCDFH